MVLLENLKRDLKIPYINRYLNDLENMGIVETTIDIRTSITKKKEKWIELKSKSLSLEDMKTKVGKRAPKQMEILNYLYE